MPLINLEYNLEDVSSERFVFPTAAYLCRIVKAELVETKETKKPMVDFTWEVFDGEFVGKRMKPDHVVLSVDWKVKQYCELAGIESGTTFNTEDFIGIEGVVTTKASTYDNKPSYDIDLIEPA